MFSPLHKRLFAALLLLPVFGLAQTAAGPDTLDSEGVISVKRAAVQASFQAYVSYMYPDLSSRSKRVSKVSRTEIVISDSAATDGPAVIPPQPLNMTSQQANLSNRKLRKHLQHDAPAKAYDWEKLFAKMNYKFEWNDTVRRDSARIQVTITNEGKASYKILPWKNEDSATLALESRTIERLRTKPLWYTARFFRGHKKSQPIACIAIITVYAFDPNMDRFMPIEVVPK